MLRNVFKPFSEYPITKKFERKGISFAIFGGSVLLFAGLVVFNLLTQGHDNVPSTVMLQTFYGPDEPLRNASSTTTCQSSLLQVSGDYYTRRPSSAHVNSGAGAQLDPGSFKWTINAFNPDEDYTLQGAYNGEELSCNATSLGITYYFSGGTYIYGICVQCTLVKPKTVTYGDTSKIRVLDLCTNYQRIVDNLPSFTDTTQNNIEKQFSDNGIQGVYTSLNFTPDQLPPAMCPSGSCANISVTPDKVDFVNIWFGDDVNYYNLNTSSQSESSTCRNSIYCPKGRYRLDGDPKEYDDLQLLFNLSAHAGTVISVLGSSQLEPSRAFNGNVSMLPGSLPRMYEILFAAGSYMFDEALRDLDGRALASSFVCTVQTWEWKSPWSLLAMLLGNTLSVWSVALTVMIALGSMLDNRPPSATLTSDPKEGTYHLLLKERQNSDI
ncbi:hypothetical protein BDZ89DRAFT_1073865 [Hymenopellis radicata]|nr:hypothetical protein BDZ89DRAFT_1073865 [Hymenopellis radicata]